MCVKTSVLINQNFHRQKFMFPKSLFDQNGKSWNNWLFNVSFFILKVMTCGTQFPNWRKDFQIITFPEKLLKDKVLRSKENNHITSIAVRILSIQLALGAWPVQGCRTYLLLKWIKESSFCEITLPSECQLHKMRNFKNLLTNVFASTKL